MKGRRGPGFISGAHRKNRSGLWALRNKPVEVRLSIMVPAHAPTALVANLPGPRWPRTSLNSSPHRRGWSSSAGVVWLEHGDLAAEPAGQRLHVVR